MNLSPHVICHSHKKQQNISTVCSKYNIKFEEILPMVGEIRQFVVRRGNLKRSLWSWHCGKAGKAVPASPVAAIACSSTSHPVPGMCQGKQ